MHDHTGVRRDGCWMLNGGRDDIDEHPEIILFLVPTNEHASLSVRPICWFRQVREQGKKGTRQEEEK